VAVDPVGPFGQGLAVNAQRDKRTVLAIKFDLTHRAVWAAPHRAPAGDAGSLRVEVEAEFHRVDEVTRRGVVFAVDGLEGVCSRSGGRQGIGTPILTRAGRTAFPPQGQCNYAVRLLIESNIGAPSTMPAHVR
jgi:hypothetical protein